MMIGCLLMVVQAFAVQIEVEAAQLTADAPMSVHITDVPDRPGLMVAVVPVGTLDFVLMRPMLRDEHGGVASTMTASIPSGTLGGGDFEVLLMDRRGFDIIERAPLVVGGSSAAVVTR